MAGGTKEQAPSLQTACFSIVSPLFVLQDLVTKDLPATIGSRNVNPWTSPLNWLELHPFQYFSLCSKQFPCV